MFIVLEVQISLDNKCNTVVNTFVDKLEAETCYYTILAAATKSDVYSHSALMFTEAGQMFKNECYVHHPVDNYIDSTVESYPEDIISGDSTVDIIGDEMTTEEIENDLELEE